MPFVDHHPILRRLIRAQNREDVVRRGLERRAHVRLHGVPGGIHFGLMAAQDVGDRSLLAGIEAKAGELVGSRR